MNATQHGRVLIGLGLMHSTLAVTPLAFGHQFVGFARRWFFKISDGLLEFPLMGGTMNFENFAAFWFFYFGLLLILLGVVVHHLGKQGLGVPRAFALGYFLVVSIGVYMIPLSGMTFLMLPHALVLVISLKPAPSPG